MRTAGTIEQPWQQHFTDPLQRWDNALTKRPPNTQTLQTIPWVKARIVATLDSSYDKQCPVGGLASRQPNPCCNDGVDEIVEKLCKEGRLEDAICLIERLVQQTTTEEALKKAYICLLKACAKRKMLREGKQVHALMVQNKCDSNNCLATNLIDMYSKCGSLLDAHAVFDALPQHNVFSWTSIISAYADAGKYKDAINLFKVMQNTGIAPDKVVFVVVLKACARAAALEEGKQIHFLILKRGLEKDMMLQNVLIDMYAKCGCIKDALELFNKMSEHDVVSWNAMISGYVHNGLGTEAIALYEQMNQESIPADKITFICVLKACAKIRALVQGKLTHSHILDKGFEQDLVVQSTLVDMYAKCGCLEDAREIFNNMIERNVVSWTAMITGYVQNGLGTEALALFEQMKLEGMQANKVTFVCVLKACANTRALEQGKQIHSLILAKGFEQDVAVQNALINMYVKCGCLEDARELFNNMSERDVVSWTAMIAGYAQNGFGKEALALYGQMKQEGMQANNVTLVCVLKVCANIRALEQGKQIHFLIMEKGFHLDISIQNTLVDMYAKCGCLEDARELFNNMNERNVVSWNAMIASYVQNGLGKEALALYEQMKQEGMEADAVTFVCVLKACSSTGALEQGKQIHFLILEKGLHQNVVVQNALIDMYSKSGCLEDACELFNNMTERDVISWNAMIAGYAQNGLHKAVFALYEEMKRESVEPNDVTYICVLDACSHSGLVEEGFRVFDIMYKHSGVAPTLEHYACMVDLLGRSGLLAEAEDFIIKMPIQPGSVVWMTLLAAARNAGNAEIGQHAFDFIEKLEPENMAPYLLLIDIYAAVN